MEVSMLITGLLLLAVLGIFGFCLDWRDRKKDRTTYRDWPDDE